MELFYFCLVNDFQKYQTFFSKYIPQEYVSYLVNIFLSHPVKFSAVKPRKTKLGDFRPNRKGKHQITVNNNLNPYAFLITALHEFAHLITYNKYGNRVAPHGTEWKVAYRQLILPVINQGDLPKDIEKALLNSLIKVKASSCSDIHLSRVLMKYDKKEDENLITLETLDKNTIFALNSKVFRKGNIRRTRVLCEEIHTQRQYLIHKLAKVKILKDEK